MSYELLGRAWWILAASGALYGQPQVLTWHNDNARTGQNLEETLLTPSNVKSATFGKLFVMNVDGKVDAQPLYMPSVIIPGKGVHNVLYVATEHDSVYAFDADNGAQLMQVSVLGANESTSDDRGCSQVTPEIGITATPAIDPLAGPHGTIYVVAMSKDASSKYHHRLHALDLTTLAEEFSGPVEVKATYPGNGAENTFLPAQHKERPGLLILNGQVYTTWGSHCDAGPYTGWVISYNETSLGQTSVLNLTPNGSDAGIWASGSGPAADANGNLYLLTGNGTFDTTLNGSGFPEHGDFGNAFVKISTNGALSVTDYFTMDNTTSESNGDVDLGSGGLMLLPPLNNMQGQPVSLVAGAGKDSNIYVVSQSNFGKFMTSSDSIYQQLSGALPGGAWSSPAWFNGKLYYGGVSDNLKSFAFSNGQFGSTPTSKSPTSFGFPGTTPSISANGASNAIAWAAENSGTATLHAYDATNLATELYNSNQAGSGRDHFGAGNKFIVPTVVNGKVYVGTTTGVGAFGLLTNVTAPSFTIGKQHSGSFTQGEINAQYTVLVTNNGLGSTNGLVIVTETVPSGLTLVSMLGSGWNCSANACMRSDALGPGSSYSAITVTVNVMSNALSPQVNSVTVSGGGSAPATTTDSTVITLGNLGSDNRTFVSTNGNDANTSALCSAAASCRTFTAALSVTSPGGEVVVLNSGAYTPAAISQPVIITADDIVVSISVTTPGSNGLTINTTGNVTLVGLSLHGEAIGSDGILISQVGFLRVYDTWIERFTNDGIHFATSGDLSVYGSTINDNAHDGLLVQNESANAYVYNTSFDDNQNAGVEVPSGRAIVSDSSADYNANAFLASGGILTLFNDRAVFNGTALVSSAGGAVYFAGCLLSNNATVYNVGTGTTMSGSGSSLITPGQATVGTLSASSLSQ